MFYFETSWIAFRRWLRLSIYSVMLLLWELRRNKSTKWTNWNISTLLSTELEILLYVAKNIYILRNVLVWTCTNLWIMMMLNDKSYMILQRFYCCGFKVVLNRLLCGLCGPRLCSHAAKRKKNFTVSHFIWHSALWKDPTVGFLKHVLLVIIEV